MLTGAIADLVERDVRVLCGWREVEVMELSVQADHVHLVCVFDSTEAVDIGVHRAAEGKLAIKLFNSYRRLKKKPYWGNHFWARGYFVSTVGADEQLIRRCVRHQENREREEEREPKDYGLFRNQPPPREP